MLLVHDLHIEEDIVPLFNFTNNKKAELELTRLFKEVPASLEEILERQQIINGFQENWPILESFSYQRLDCREVQERFEQLINGNMLPQNKTRATFQLFLSETARNKERSHAVQTIIFLDNISKKFFFRINKNKFPTTFKYELEIFSSFLQKLNLAYYAELIKENNFSVREIIHFRQILDKLDKKEIKTFWQFLYRFEAYFSITKAVLKHNFTFPVFDNTVFKLQSFYHPLLTNPVKNSLVLEPEENVIILTGPNMSGKSTLLKAIDLCVYLAHIGVGVPATYCHIPFFQSIAIAINLTDNLKTGYSHFMAEIQHLKLVLQEARKPGKSFVIFDELFKGTNIDDAQEITLTTIQGLSGLNNSLFFISTHLLQLETDISDLNKRVKKYYIDLQINDGLPQFTYELKAGWSNIKLGKYLFETEGLTELLKA